MNLFLWGALPYIAFTFLIVGTLVRFFYFERNWTTKSSEFLEKKQLRIANPLFHFGLLCVIGGHVVGVLIPKTWTAAIGINVAFFCRNISNIFTVQSDMTFI